MLEEKIPIHCVCTHDEAKELIKNHDKFWISNCGCREGLGSKCTRSRIEVCLSFTETDEASGSEKKPVDRAFADGIMKEAEDKTLVTVRGVAKTAPKPKVSVFAVMTAVPTL